MNTHEYSDLRINRVDITASKQSGLSPFFCVIKRCYGDDEALDYLRNTKQTTLPLNAVFNTGDSPNRLQAEVFV